MIPAWLRWMTRPVSTAPEEAPAPAAKPNPRRKAGTYQPLHEYLQNRHADMVVLTLEQIEDLLGFPLPAPARSDQSWWADTTASPTEARSSDAWTLANRTARPNLWAQTVAFERVA